MGDGLSPLSAAAPGTGIGWNISIEEKVVKADLLSPQLHQQRALSLAEFLVELQHFLDGRRRVLVRRVAVLVFSPRAYPLYLRLSLTPSSERCPEWAQLGRGVGWLLAAAVLPQFGGFFGSLVGGLVSWDACVGRCPSDSH